MVRIIRLNDLGSDYGYDPYATGLFASRDSDAIGSGADGIVYNEEDVLIESFEKGNLSNPNENLSGLGESLVQGESNAGNEAEAA